MRLPLLRMRIWWIMALVAASAVTLYVGIEVPRLRRLGLHYRTLSQRHLDLGRAARVGVAAQAEALAFWSDLAKQRRGYAEAGRPRPDSDESWEDAATRSAQQAEWHAQSIAFSRKRAAYHDAMRRKWLWAARYPWFRVEADAPLVDDATRRVLFDPEDLPAPSAVPPSRALPAPPIPGLGFTGS